jgi:hypothetical protein
MLSQVARRLGIKYSTAKTFTRNYQSLPEEKNTALVDALCDLFERRPRTRRRCGYRLLSEAGANPNHIEIVCSSLSAAL